MSPHKPEDWPRLFEQHLNAGNLDAVMALYEPNASFVPQSGETIVGHDGIRQMMVGLIGMKARLHGRVVKVIPAGDVALLYTDWKGTTLDPSGKTARSRYKAIEIVRLQGDGTWKLIVGDPNGRASLHT
jgi:uncharacterized protein (TIGR02246 family)